MPAGLFPLVTAVCAACEQESRHTRPGSGAFVRAPLTACSVKDPSGAESGTEGEVAAATAEAEAERVELLALRRQLRERERRLHERERHLQSKEAVIQVRTP